LTTAELAARIQFTLVRADATAAEIRRHCEAAAQAGVQGVMIQPCWVRLAREILAGSGVKVATAVAYPMGGETAEMKAGLMREAVRLGAEEIDFQPNMGFLRSGMLEEFAAEIRMVVAAADGRPVKSMSEFGFLNEEQRRLCVQIAEECGVAQIKNSSGIGPGGSPATVEDILFIRRHLKGRAGVKVSGGIRSRAQAEALIAAGADLLGTSAALEILAGSEAASADY
jgi:deoxyribose-phosphate aldolase